MKINLKQKFKDAITGYQNAFINAPIAMILCGLIGCLALIHHHADLSENLADQIEKGAMVCILGIPFSMFMGQIVHRLNRNVALQVIGRIATIAFLVLYFLWGIPAFEMKPITRIIGLILLFTTAYVLIYNERDKEQYEKFTLYALKRLLFTVVYTLVIWGGISFTFFAFSELMDIKLWREAYLDFLFVTLSFIIPSYFFSGIPKEKPEELPDVSLFVTTLVSYILIPVILAYTAVLYLYFLKLLVTFQWPEGMLGHLVFWYGLVSAAVMYFLFPFVKDKRITDIFYKYFPYLIIIPLVMMFISLGIRIKAYGFTEPRYWVGMVGLWIFVSMLLFLFKDRLKNVNRAVLALLVIACLVSVIGPVSAYAVSVRSQNKQFQMLEKKYDFFSETKLFNPENMSTEDRERAGSILRYFDRNHTLEDLKVPERISKEDLRTMFEYDVFYEKYRYISINTVDSPSMDIRGYDYLLGMYADHFNVKSDDGTEYQIIIEKGKDFIVKTGTKEVYRNDLSEFIIRTYQNEIRQGQGSGKSLDSNTFEIPGTLMIFDDENELFHIRFFVQSAFCRLYPDGTMEVDSLSYYTALKLKK